MWPGSAPERSIRMQIWIKSLVGRKDDCNFEPDTTVMQVKEYLEVREVSAI